MSPSPPEGTKSPQPPLSAYFRRLVDIFLFLNTQLTFIASHARSLVPSFDLITKLNPDITATDLAEIKVLFSPGAIFFDYIDENELHLSLIEDVKHTWERGYASTPVDPYAPQSSNSSRQVLLFDFRDTRVDGVATTFGGQHRRKLEDPSGFFLLLKAIQVKLLSNTHLKQMITGRRKRFIECVAKFIEKHGDEAEEELRKKAIVPVPVDYEADKVENQGKRRRLGSLETEKRPSVDTLFEAVTAADFYREQVTFDGYLTRSSPARYCDFPMMVDGECTIHPELHQALISERGIDIANQMYTHQAEAISALLSESTQHVIVSTATGSGKSLIYQIPVLNDILWDRSCGEKRKSTAIFVFPTKALAQDQMQALKKLLTHMPSLDGLVIDTYDGDTPSKHRPYVRANADIIFTNPDTIHASILPGADAWKDFLLGLKYVVMDEIHVYRGLFGIHVSMVMARLRRIVLSPFLFVLCSATIHDPVAHFRVVCALGDETIIHVNDDGSPMRDRRMLAWQPPELMSKLGATTGPFVPRESVISELARIVCQILTQVPWAKLLVFCTHRKMCEFLVKEIRTALPGFKNKTGVTLAEVMAYRGGYAKADRRAIERKMFNGELRAIIATNALELGIDLLDIDVVIACGFPMSKLNLHQQFGRAGRGKKSQGSLAIFVGGGNATDTHYLNHGSELLARDYEDLCVASLIASGSNKLVAEMHMQCAAFERPIVEEDARWFGSYFENGLKKLHIDGTGRYRCDPSYLPWPLEKVGIRSVDEQLYAIVDTTNGGRNVLEEIEAVRIPFTIYEGAIFLHQGHPYLVKEFNADERFALVERTNVSWTTTQRDFTDIDPVEIDYVKQMYGPDGATNLPVFYGLIRSEMKVFGYFKISRRGEILEAVDVDQPLVVRWLKGFWIDIPLTAIEIITEKKLNPAAGIHAAQHALINILPRFICGATTGGNVQWTSNMGEAEISTECKAPEKEFAQRQTRRKRPSRIVFYDSHGGKQGLGMCAKTFEHIDDILLATLAGVTACECQWGCPSCVLASFCREQLLVMSKPAAIIILAALLGKKPEEYRNLVDDGPEANLPKVDIETIGVAPQVRFAPDVEILNYQTIKRHQESINLDVVKVKAEPE